MILYTECFSTQSETQALLDIVSDITSKDLVKINPSKSELVPLTKIHSDFSLPMALFILF